MPGLARPVAAQEEQAEPEVTELERLSAELAAVQTRIAQIQARQADSVPGEQALMRDQLRRRWSEHHEILDDLVAEITVAREEGREMPAITELARAALVDEIEMLGPSARALEAEVSELSASRSDTETAGLVGLEAKIAASTEVLDLLYGFTVTDFDQAGFLGIEIPNEAAFDSALIVHADLVAARVELALERRSQFRELLATPGVDSATVGQQLAAVDAQVRWTVVSLENTAGLLEQRDLETSAYAKLLVTATGELGTNILDPEVVGGLFSDGMDVVSDWFAANGGALALTAFTAIFVLLITWVFSRVGRRAIGRVLDSDRVKTTGLLKKLITGIASKVIWLLGFLVLLSVLGIDVGPALAGVGIAGFVIGFALQDSLANFAAGLMIMLYRPFDVGDVVTAGGVRGTVTGLTLVSTVITTLDNERVVVPNGQVWGSSITNSTAEPVRRVDLVFGIGYEDDIGKARGILEQILADDPLVLDQPEPVVRLDNLGDSSVDFVVRPWCKTPDYWETGWSVTQAVKQRFDAEGVSIPFPQRDVHLYPTDGGEADA
jgi:small conductance mechanosensitive channel